VIEFNKKKIDFAEGEILNINKPQGWTSFDVIKKIRSICKIKKLGHAGTLDPFATGVLIICIGKATKKINELTALDKEYIGEIELGISTDTLDVTGKVLSKKEIPKILKEEFEEICKKFIGEIEQIPPMYSAKRINGKRLYNLARKGIVVERKTKKVTIYNIKVVDFNLPIIKLKVSCSKGTYVRTLADDIGNTIGCGAYLKSLVRTKAGQFKIEDSLNIENFEKMVRNGSNLRN
jgi:tRNA pseudouridine55 synthase